MNSSTPQLVLIVNYWILITSSISVILSLGILGFLSYHLLKTKNSSNRIVLLLTANIYCALLYSSIMFVDQYARVLPAHLYSIISLNDGLYCQIRGYFHWVPFCAIFYSNTLQAIYRLCQIVFYTRPLFRSYKFYQILIFIQWIICFLLPIPTLLLGDFRYSNDDYNCQNDSTNIRSAFMNGTLTYVLPMNITNFCYLYTLIQMRKGNNSLIHTMTQIQQINAQRNLVVLFRICILSGLLASFFIPSIILLFNYIATGYMPWWAALCQSFILSFSTNSVIIILPFISPQIRHLVRINTFQHRHHLNSRRLNIIRTN